MIGFKVKVLDISQKNKIVFVDFDDTLFIWRHDRIKKYESSILTHMVSNDFYDDSVGIYNTELIERLKRAKVSSNIILLSHTPTTLEFRSKVMNVEGLFPDLFDDYIGTDGADSKIKVMECYAEKYSVEHDNIMLIDDVKETLHKAKERGFKARTPMETMLSEIW